MTMMKRKGDNGSPYLCFPMAFGFIGIFFSMCDFGAFLLVLLVGPSPIRAKSDQGRLV